VRYLIIYDVTDDNLRALVASSWNHRYEGLRFAFHGGRDGHGDGPELVVV